MKHLACTAAGLLLAAVVLAGLQSCKTANTHAGGYYQCAACKATSDQLGKCCGKDLFPRNYLCTKCEAYAPEAGKCCGQDLKKAGKCSGCGSYCPVGEKCCGKTIGG